MRHVALGLAANCARLFVRCCRKYNILLDPNHTSATPRTRLPSGQGEGSIVSDRINNNLVMGNEQGGADAHNAQAGDFMPPEVSAVRNTVFVS